MADMTTGPAGERFDYPERLTEILARYPADSVVTRAMKRAQPDIEAAIKRTRARIAELGDSWTDAVAQGVVDPGQH